MPGSVLPVGRRFALLAAVLLGMSVSTSDALCGILKSRNPRTRCQTPILIHSEADTKDAVVGRCVSDASLLLRRPAPDKPWQLVSASEELNAGELLLGGPGASFDSKGGSVRLTFLGEMSGTSGYPVRETAVILHESSDVDLDITLDRGRVDLVNRKKKGAARIRVRIRDRQGEVVLATPGSELAVEMFSRWLPGTPFRKEPKAGESPTVALVAIALKGEVQVKGKKQEFFLKAPPGPALLQVESLEDASFSSPVYMEKAPDWVSGQKLEKQKKLLAMGKRFRREMIAKSLGDAIDMLLASDDVDERRVAIYLMGATDDLERLGQALQNAKQKDVWDTGVLALRHWIGRGPGQDQKLYRGLIEKGKMPPAQVETVLTLLHGFGEEELKQPVTYQALLRLLESDRLALRGLAYWHLYRLAPDGREFDYDPLAAEEKRAEAVKRWRQLIPPGKLPPPIRSEP
jgi:hypothetical protein